MENVEDRDTVEDIELVGGSVSVDDRDKDFEVDCDVDSVAVMDPENEKDVDREVERVDEGVGVGGGVTVRDWVVLIVVVCDVVFELVIESRCVNVKWLRDVDADLLADADPVADMDRVAL